MLNSLKKITSSDMEEGILSVFKTMPVPIIVLKPEFNILNHIVDFTVEFVNNPAILALEISEDKIVGNRLLNLFPTHRHSGLFDRLCRVFKTGQTEFHLNNFNNKDVNRPKDNFGLNVSKLRDRLIANWQDKSLLLNQIDDLVEPKDGLKPDIEKQVDSRLRLNEQVDKLKASNEDLEQFAYIASHDLQEPLRMVTSFTQLLEKRYADKLDQDAKEYIRFAVDGAIRMKELIDHLLIYSRIVTRTKPYVMVDINELINKIIEDFKFLIEENNAEIIYKDLPVIYSDESMLMQVFKNLISNAIKYRSNEKPMIIISASQNDYETLFSVKDNGIGIDKKYFEKIFLIFQRLHSKNKYPGTGIGLAICKRIIEKLHGKIWVESEPGKGSAFYFTIPRMEQ